MVIDILDSGEYFPDASTFVKVLIMQLILNNFGMQLELDLTSEYGICNL